MTGSPLRNARRALAKRLPLHVRMRIRLLREAWSPRSLLRDLRAEIVLISFPKCGRTWLRVMLSRALSLHYAIDLESIELEDLAEHEPRIPRMRVTHDDDPHWRTPSELHTSKRRYRSKRVILLVRDPRDVVVSLYYQKKKRERSYEKSLPEFLREPRGSFATVLEFFRIWERERATPKDLLLLRYEDLHVDAATQLRRVLDFMGIQGVSNEHIAAAVEFAKFDNMRAMELEDRFRSPRLRPKDPTDPDTFKTRQGRVHGYRESLSPEDVAWLDERVAKELPKLYGYG